MDSCIFCKIILKETPSILLFEDDSTISFMELNPSAPGHSMVISKRHGFSILDYTDEELGKIMRTVKKITKAIKNSLNCDSITIGINHYEKRGVPHLHIHLIPRWANDRGGAIQSVVTNKGTSSREEIAEKIKKAI